MYKKSTLFSSGLVLLSFVLLLSSCSNRNDSQVSSFPLASPARFGYLNKTTFIVSDYGNQTLLLVDKNSLTPFRSISLTGQPTGVAYTEHKGGRFFVGNRSSGSVDIYTAAGEFVGYLGGRTGLFDQVNDLVIDDVDEFVYVLDSAAARISVYDYDGNLYTTDLAPGILVRPSALFLGTDELLYISDFGDPGNLIPVLPRVWIMDQSGSVVDSLIADSGGSFGKYSFSTPQGVYLDQDGYLYLVEARAGMVQIYDLYGQLGNKSQVATLGTLGVEVGELFYPLDVIVDEVSKDVYVTDNSNNRLTVFAAGGVIP